MGRPTTTKKEEKSTIINFTQPILKNREVNPNDSCIYYTTNTILDRQNNKTIVQKYISKKNEIQNNNYIKRTNNMNDFITSTLNKYYKKNKKEPTLEQILKWSCCQDSITQNYKYCIGFLKKNKKFYKLQWRDVRNYSK